MHRISLLAICLLGISSTAFADPVTIFGIPLGEKFTLQRCAKSNPITVASNCWTYKFSPHLMPDSTDTRSLHFANEPALGHDITAFVHAGVMDIVTIETSGVDTQDYVMSQLTQKFGKPTHFEKVPVQNRMGAKFIVDRAEWNTSQLSARFDADGSDGGMHEGTIDKGWISIETQKYHAEGLKKREDFLKKRQQL
jgi:hypothetical protein